MRALGFSGARRVAVKAPIAGQEHRQPEGREQRPVGVHPFALLG